MTEQSTNEKRLSKAFEWAKLLSVTGSVQLAVQVISMVSGFLITKHLNETQFAIYVMANNLLGTMVILADGGISNGIMALGSRVHEDRKLLGAVINTGLDIRKKFSIAAIVIAAPILIIMFVQNKQSISTALIILLCLLPTFFSQLSGKMYEIAAMIKQDIMPLQRVRFEANIGRLLLICLVAFLLPYAFLALLAAGIPQYYANYKMRKNAVNYVDFVQKPDPEYRKSILKVVARILPGAAYFSISSQINIYLISFFSNNGAKSITEIGGLDRLAMVLTVFSTMFVTLITPRYAKLPDERGILRNRFIQIFAGLSLLCLFIIGFVWLTDTYLLMVIGDKFKGLEHALLLNIIGNCLGMMAGNMYSLFTNRGWNLHPALSIFLNMASISAGVMLFPIGTVIGVLHMNIFISSVNLLINGGYLIYKIYTIKKG